MTAVTSLDRRAFLQQLGATGAFALGFSLPGGRIVSALAAQAAGAAWVPSAFLTIDAAGQVTIVAHRSEMGQGSRVTLAAAVADELGADLERVRVVQAEGDEKKYGSQNTDGSHSVRDFLVPLREVGASARQMLEAAAAKQWGAPATDVEARNHQVVHRRDGRTLTFGALVATARTLPVPAKADLQLKPASALRYLGKRVPFVDAMAMTTGAAMYGQDARLPGMKFAVIARPPVYGGSIASVDDTAAKKVPGVERIVRMTTAVPPAAFKPLGGVAVIANSTWAALQGRDALTIAWTDGPNAALDSTRYREALETVVKAPGNVARNEGDVTAALASAARKVSADYYVPQLAHAVMEPPAALASFKDGTCEVWACTQHPQGARDEVAGALGIGADKVTVHVTFLGGGFGRKSKPDFIVEAALLSREAGAPVKVVWTRDDELRHGYYHAVAAQHLEAGLDTNGKVVAWLHRTAFPSINATFAPGVEYASEGELGLGCIDAPWNVANLRCETGKAPAHTRIGWFRSVCNIQHAFAACSFVDELAHAAGRDPRDFLLDLIGPPRHVDPTKGGVKEWNYGADPKVFPFDTARLRAVVELAARESGWGQPLPKGRGRGIAVHRSFLTYVATVVEVAVAPDGSYAVPRVDMAVDCGFPANPDRIRAQMEGAAVMAFTLARYGEITFKGGRVEQSNFHDFPIARIDAVPRDVRVHIVPSEAPAAGVGEPGVPPFSPALCNAIFAATGRRIRALPIGDRLA
jgi:isoquinoline 1-oxidoreductase beta subunit